MPKPTVAKLAQQIAELEQWIHDHDNETQQVIDLSDLAVETHRRLNNAAKLYNSMAKNVTKLLREYEQLKRDHNGFIKIWNATVPDLYKDVAALKERLDLHERRNDCIAEQYGGRRLN